ncbi:hypothetical protein CDAR_297911 [Caerostris darwini]|uniref:Uncharacterized protein n=1 Tax=Caerostris darwini TaxID=1538125 RepID=A0AAV4PNG3_9ARAC|nr:hypothetical protein CDAR_297911 [Caerostris darwini]
MCNLPEVDGGDDIWQHSALTAGAGVAASILIVVAVCIYYFRRVYLEKKHRPMGATKTLMCHITVVSVVQRT